MAGQTCPETRLLNSSLKYCRKAEIARGCIRLNPPDGYTWVTHGADFARSNDDTRRIRPDFDSVDNRLISGPSSDQHYESRATPSAAARVTQLL
jgi:hypothetical protein